ncbi:peroxisomal biogenesis factor 11 [Halteromyces radiatus]|uniref:peroxisomal biogenesis factor 11 n=1 Tax=Halteromyces radiatus TaxID=101107 RepID=UPI00221FD2F3|nr:peroxisomal biogenesis factor 11 [Halteromyces radiatus]KAI8093680.1 peroxisomal biogenesis factor 11 [Halteromyces radiatus]
MISNINHSHVDAINKFLATTTGREKLCRLVQYFSRFYVFYLTRAGASKDVIKRWAELKGHIGNARKFFRLLKPIEFAQNGVKGLTLQDPVLRATTVIKQAGMFLYYTTEAINLGNLINFRKVDNIKKITTFGQKCWFVALTASLVSGLYKFKLLAAKEAKLATSEKVDQADAKKLAKDQFNTRYQFIQDCCDIIIPTAGLGWIGFDEGIVGIAGMITSAMAARNQWYKVNPQ